MSDHDDGGNRGELARIARQAMLDRGLWPDYSAAVRAQVAAIAGPAEDDNARDLRQLPWCSIDNDDSLDLDQLTVADELAEGSVRVRVAIADVAALVEKDSPVDAHAAHNTTSIYTGGRVFAMLPERLSTELTSLADGTDRLAVVTELRFDADGTATGSDVYRATVHNHAKLAYNGVAPWLENEGPAPAALLRVPGLAACLRLQDRVAQQLRTSRFRRGALDLDTIEARPLFDGDRLRALEEDRKSRAKQLIEDLMIATNEATAHFLEAHGFPSLRRVLRSPERWVRIVALAAESGDRLPSEPDAEALAAFLARRHDADPLRFPDLSLAVVKLMGSGEYVLDLPGGGSPGHFGLAVRDYTHSTAPNRRFPDLVTQRLLQAAMAKEPWPYTQGELEAIAARCTQREDDANKVERQVRKSAAALLLEDRVGQRFEAIVTGASEKGTWVRVLRPPVEGKLERGYEGLDVGDRLRVQLTGTDAQRGFIDFVRVP
jgi:VacB/RNase II family 3'-5' exoribonuclease